MTPSPATNPEIPRSPTPRLEVRTPIAKANWGKKLECRHFSLPLWGCWRMMCFCHGTVKIIVHHRSICLVDHETFTPIFQNLVTCTLTLRKLQIYFRKCVKIYSNSTAHKTSERNLQKKFSKAIKRSETLKKKNLGVFVAPVFSLFFRVEEYSVSRLRCGRPVITGTLSCSKNFSSTSFEKHSKTRTIHTIHTMSKHDVQV